MATVIAASPIDMMAPNQWLGTIVSTSPTQIVIETDDGLTTRLEGNFQFSSNGVAGGTVTGFSQADDDSALLAVLGLSFNASDAYAIIQNGNENAIWQTILAQADTIYGSLVDDVLVGFDGDDLFMPSFGSDTVFGGDGNDTLHFVEGSDTFDGELGLDKIVFELDQSAVNIILNQDASYIVSVNDTIDQITTNSVERLSFADNNFIALDIAVGENAGMAYRMYEAALDREPDVNGLADWIRFLDNGSSALDMASMFISSPEFNNLYGNLDNAAFVNQLYLNVLDREGEEEGVEAWTNALADGVSRSQVPFGFSESAANITNTAPEIETGIYHTEWWAA